jgi:hypothetical protein
MDGKQLTSAIVGGKVFLEDLGCNVRNHWSKTLHKIQRGRMATLLMQHIPARSSFVPGCVCVNVYSGEDGAIQKLLSGHLSLFRSIELTSHII